MYKAARHNYLAKSLFSLYYILFFFIKILFINFVYCMIVMANWIVKYLSVKTKIITAAIFLFFNLGNFGHVILVE